MNRLFFLLILCLCCGQARAQYVTNLTLLKNQFLTGEPVVAVVSVTNRSGADVIVGGHGAPDWLQFEITQSTGQRLSPITIAVSYTHLDVYKRQVRAPAHQDLLWYWGSDRHQA